MCELIAQYLKETQDVDLSWRVIANFDKNNKYGSFSALYAKAKKYYN